MFKKITPPHTLLATPKHPSLDKLLVIRQSFCLGRVLQLKFLQSLPSFSSVYTYQVNKHFFGFNIISILLRKLVFDKIH